MSKQEQILIIDPPNELSFVGPFTTPVSSAMKLSNPSDRRVCFKIKTTAPKRYCVKPNSGVIDPSQTVQISVSLQPFEFDPAEKNKHKFMVQSMFAPDGEINQETLWKETDANQLMDSKLKCVFVMPEENNSRDEFNASSSSSMQSKSEFNSKSSGLPSKMAAESDDPNIKRTLDEIKRLQEETSSLRQENIQLKEESLRLKRLAANRNPDESSSAPVGYQSASKVGGSSSSPGFNSTLVTASNPNANALSTTYIYAAIVILVLGIIVGKWVI